MHHTMEERFIFPELAKFMPKFGNTNEGEHLASHRGIHEGTKHIVLYRISANPHAVYVYNPGLENLDTLIAKWKKDSSKYSPKEMRACLDGFREVLFHHLDEEVMLTTGDLKFLSRDTDWHSIGC